MPLELLLPGEMEFDGTSSITEVVSPSGSKQTWPWAPRGGYEVIAYWPRAARE